MAREYSNKITLRPPPGGVPFPVNPINIVLVAVDPNGNQDGTAGDLALLAGGIAMWRCAGGSVWIPVGAGGGNGPCVLGWGNNLVGYTTTPRYLTPWYDGDLALVAPVRAEAPRAGTLRSLRVRHTTPAGNGNPIAYTVRVNGVASALTATLLSTAASGSNLINTVAVAAGDLLDLEVTKPLSIGTSPTGVTVDVEFI